MSLMDCRYDMTRLVADAAPSLHALLIWSWADAELVAGTGRESSEVTGECEGLLFYGPIEYARDSLMSLQKVV